MANANTNILSVFEGFSQNVNSGFTKPDAAGTSPPLAHTPRLTVLGAAADNLATTYSRSSNEALRNHFVFLTTAKLSETILLSEKYLIRKRHCKKPTVPPVHTNRVHIKWKKPTINK